MLSVMAPCIFSFFGPFTSYKKIEMLWIRPFSFSYFWRLRLPFKTSIFRKLYPSYFFSVHRGVHQEHGCHLWHCRMRLPLAVLRCDRHPHAPLLLPLRRGVDAVKLLPCLRNKLECWSIATILRIDKAKWGILMHKASFKFFLRHWLMDKISLLDSFYKLSMSAVY